MINLANKRPSLADKLAKETEKKGIDALIPTTLQHIDIETSEQIKKADLKIKYISTDNYKNIDDYIKQPLRKTYHVQRDMIIAIDYLAHATEQSRTKVINILLETAVDKLLLDLIQDYYKDRLKENVKLEDLDSSKAYKKYIDKQLDKKSNNLDVVEKILEILEVKKIK